MAAQAAASLGGPPTSIAAQADYPPRSQAWWMVALLFMAACLSNIDRLVISVVIDPIRADLHISDVQMSLLLGVAYGSCYGLFSVVLGFAVDRLPRRAVLIFGVLLWSAATVATGLARSYPALFAARALVGLGEASVVPAALSVLTDFFPPHLRGRPVAFYLVGASLGSGVAMLLPGRIMAAHLALSLPGFGPAPPWRTVFVMCGLAGPLVGLLFLTTREPPRRGVVLQGESPLGLGRNLAFLARNWAVFLPLYLGFGLFLLAMIGILSWQAALVLRRFHLSAADISYSFGLTMLVAGVAGYFLGGVIVDSRLAAGPRGRLAVLAGACLLGLPCGAATLATSPLMAIVLLCSISVAGPIAYVAMNAVIQDIAPANMRGFAVSVNGLTSTLISFSGGPLLISLATEKVFHDPAALGPAAALVVMPALLAAAVVFVLCGLNLGREIDRGGELAEVAAVNQPA